MLIGLQRKAGNAAVTRMLQGTQSAGPSLQRRTVTEERAGHPVISQALGSTGPYVSELQRALNTDLQMVRLNVNGIFDAATHQVLIEFQRRHGLTANGVCDAATWGMVGSLARAGLPRLLGLPTLGPTAPVGPIGQQTIENILHPPVPPPPGGGPAPAHPPMTGAGVGGAFEHACFAALDAHYTAYAAQRLAAIHSGVDVKNFADVSAAAQEETERFYGEHLTMASRSPAGAYHPGSFTPPLAASGTRTVNVPTAWGWTRYFLNDPSYPAHQPLITHQVFQGPGRPDAAEVTRVAHAYVTSSPARMQKITHTIQGWPAEAGTGTVFINTRFQGISQLQAQWDLFTTLIHEFLHLVTHPNYNRTATAVGGTAQQILIEGMTDHFRDQVWQGLLPGLGGNTALRQRVEGASFQAPPTPAAYVPHTFYAQKPDADTIAAAAGESNARAAYFMGHAERLGIGVRTASVAPLGGLAGWTPADADQDGVYRVRAGGETLQQIMDRASVSSPIGRITEMDGSSVGGSRGRAFPANYQLRVRGIHWHQAIQEDTRAQVANQYGVGLFQLERANSWAHAPGETPIPAGSVILIPVS